MRRITFRPDFGNRDFITLAATACWHIGNPSSDDSAIVRMLHAIKRRKLPWIHHGDSIEAIAPTDKRFSADTHRDTVMRQLQRAADLMRIAREWLVGLHIGNHEDKVSRMMGDMTMDLLMRVYQDDAEAARRWLGGVCMTQIVCPGGACDVMSAHSDISFGGGTSDPLMDEERCRTKLRRYVGKFSADLKLVAHAHRAVIAPPVAVPVVAFGGAAVRRDRPEWCAAVPSMMRTYADGDSDAYPNYAELAVYGPSRCGWIECDIERDGRVIDVRGVYV